MPKTIPAGLTKRDIVEAIQDRDYGIEHPFVKSTGYVVVHNDKRYSPKAVIGIAFKHFRSEILPPSEFSGGEAPGQANYVLRKLGFSVINKEDEDEPKTGKAWSENEVQLIVKDYFAMLELELLNKPYKKSEHRKRLLPKLSGRSNGSVEFRHQNISAVLTRLGMPYIQGYKPRGNLQNLLEIEVGNFLDQNDGLIENLMDAPVVSPTEPRKLEATNLDLVIEAPPESMVFPKSSAKPWLSRKGRKENFAERDARNRHLGKIGEQFVFDLERYRLRTSGRDDLSQKVQWVARDIGDGLGFDILSFDEIDDSEKMVEVKTTGLGKFFPFFVTANELNCSVDIPEQYHLYRVFDFGREPRLFILHGALNDLCKLDPVLYRALV